MAVATVRETVKAICISFLVAIFSLLYQDILTLCGIDDDQFLISISFEIIFLPIIVFFRKVYKFYMGFFIMSACNYNYGITYVIAFTSVYFFFFILDQDRVHLCRAKRQFAFIIALLVVGSFVCGSVGKLYGSFKPENVFNLTRAYLHFCGLPFYFYFMYEMPSYGATYLVYLYFHIENILWRRAIDPVRLLRNWHLRHVLLRFLPWTKI